MEVKNHPAGLRCLAVFSSKLRFLDVSRHAQCLAVFDEESDFQVKQWKSDAQMPKIRKTNPDNLHKILLFSY